MPDSLAINLKQNFVFGFNVGVNYRSPTNIILHQANTISPVYRIMASGGVPPYIFNITGFLPGEIFGFKVRPGTAWYESYADLYIVESQQLSPNQAAVYPITVSCVDSIGATISATGIVSIKRSVIDCTVSGLPQTTTVLSSIPLSSLVKGIAVPLVVREQVLEKQEYTITFKSESKSRLTLILTGKPSGSTLERPDKDINEWTLTADFRTSKADKLHIIKYYLVEIGSWGAITHPSNRILLFTKGLGNA